MKKYVIASFYKFVELPNYSALKQVFLNNMNHHCLLGTIILAHEGINGCIAGQREAMEAFYAKLRSNENFQDVTFKETFDDFIPFEKAKVKLRQEIVTMGIQEVSSLPTSLGTHVSPNQWNELISDPNVVVVDTRNNYEVKLGTFKHAINPKTDNFRQFPQFVQQHLLDKKDKKIAMFCTGGIRCEKSTAYLKSLGFKQVYQLEGGILNYFEKTPENESLWEGTCFVFDDRIAIEQ